MKTITKLLLLIFIVSIGIGCSDVEENKEPVKVEKKVINETDETYGYYLFVKPKTTDIKGVLVLFPGFTQSSEDIFLDTDLQDFASENGLLTIGFAGKMRKTADSLLQLRISDVLEDVLNEFEVKKDKFVLGGFSAGGIIALRYAELCKQNPERFPIEPKGVFMVDSPVDLFHFWKLSEEIMKTNYSEISTAEAKMVERVYRHYYGTTPSENPERFIELSPFSIDKKYGTNEQYLKDVGVRAYHDVDIVWRLKNRNQTARFENYIASSELINRLMLMGNTQAEFIQTFEKGYRRNGKRHPHSWSIVDGEECIEWMLELLKK